MTKKDYIKFAKMIAGQVSAIEKLRSQAINTNYAFSDGYSVAIFNTANQIADLFADDNPHFDRQRFLIACGLK